MVKAAENFTKLIRGIIALIFVGVIGALIIFNPIVSGVIGGFVATSNLHARAADEVNERIYTTACVLYKKADTWDRWTNPRFWKMGWCEDYLDRM
jgi:hypothetical protein